jgi:phenylglyoxylate dehydrogenase epsilon subunit
MDTGGEAIMDHSKYLIVGSSHAGLSAIEAIRVQDTDGAMTLLTQEEHFPYSPTILPYVVSAKVNAGKVFLMDQAYMDRLAVKFKPSAKVVGVDPASRIVSLESGESLEYENLLLATGAEPTLPPIPGLQEAPFHVLRSLEDAERLRQAAQEAKSAIILGAGLIGMHAAESLAQAGLYVTIVEALPQLLPGYFEAQAAGLIQKVFEEHGLHILTGSMVTHVTSLNGACAVSLESGLDLSADLLVVATGVKPRISYLAGSGIEATEGILVDDTMRTTASNIWAAGDVAQAQSFLDSSKVVQGTLPTAVEQGRTAGLDMVGDPALKRYPGNVPMNTYKFFGHRSFSIGLVDVTEPSESIEVDHVFLPSGMKYQKFVYQYDRLVGVSCINASVDPGIMHQLIRRRIDLSDVKKRFAGAPLEIGRLLMTRTWS